MLHITTTKKLVAFDNGATAMLEIHPHKGRKHNIKMVCYNPSNAYFAHLQKIKKQEEMVKNRKPIVVPINTDAFHGYWARTLFKRIANELTPETLI